MARLIRTFASLFALLLVASAEAAPVTRPATKGSPAIAAVSQFVDENTVAVAAIDVAAVDPEGLNAWLLQFLKSGQSPQKDIDGMAYGLRYLIPGTQKWVGDFGRAGGRGLFLVISIDPAAPVLVVAPLEGRASAPALSQLMFSPFGIPLPAGKPVAAQPATKPGAVPPDNTGYYVDRFGSALVLGSERAIRKAATISARKDRPYRAELLDGLVESGPGGVRVSMAMTQELRAQLRELGAKLPAELGGEPTAVLTDKLKWAVLSIALPAKARPQMTIRLSARGSDSESGKSLGNILKSLFRTAANEGDLAKHPDKDKVLALFEPKVVGDTVEVQLTQDELAKTAAVFGPMAIKARIAAAKSQSETKLKNLASAIRNAALEQNGRMPQAVTDQNVLKFVGTKPNEQRDALINPLNPERTPGYGYVRLADNALQIANPFGAIMLYEMYDQWPADGIRVAYASGMVGEIKTEAEFRKLVRK